MANTILPGGLTNIQNEFLKLRLQNNPEFMAEYFPNVVLNPPSGPLYDVDPSLDRPFSYPVKAVYETGENKVAGPFDYLKNSGTIPTSAAQFTKENVPYDTPGSVLDINPMSSSETIPAYAYTSPENMYQGIKKGTDLPVTEGQSSAMYMMPEMIADYGTAPKAPRNERVPTPSWWPNQNIEHVNQVDINEFIEDVGSHEVSHNVSYLPEYKGITSMATNIDFNKLFPGAASKEAQKAITRLNLLQQRGGALDATGELINENIGYGDYPSTWIENLNEFDQEEVYNRAKDIEKMRRQFPNSYWDRASYRNNLNFLRQRFKKFPKTFPDSDDKTDIYLKKIEPQVTQYLEKVTGGGGEKWSPGVGATQRGSNAPGFTDPGKGSYGPWKADGGLATMFERRR